MHKASLTLVLPVVIAAAIASCSERFPATPPAADAGLPPGQLEANPPAVIDAKSRVNASSASVAFDALRGTVWTANGDVGTVSDVDPIGRRVLAEIPIGQDTRSVAVSPDGAWVAVVDRGGATLTLLDAASRSIQRVLPLGSHPRACVWDAADPRWLYVAEEDAGVVDVVDRTLGALVATIPVGRLPSALAVSSSRRELYVSHRIDADVTVVDLQARAVAAHVPLADEPFSAPAVPNGKPLGFESLAVTPDGVRAWLPHELLGRTHPFVFNQTVFPAVSVANLVDRVEQQTDPATGDIAGRKNLFDAIEVFGQDGQPEVFSQPCAVAIHPDAQVAWVLMCGSEDLVTFGVGHGAATDAIRGLPCDHPSGMTLDAAGDRVFVLCDQSKQLLTFDTAHGSPVGHTTLLGAPIDVAVDTVAKADPDLRAGLTLFFRANSAKGALWATTASDWLSCSACHLDGFGSTNLRLFESLLPPPDPAHDAEVGHVGLLDDFSTAVQSGQAGFQPHDLLAALLDQGGLAPDRTGKSRAGQVDPSAPPATAVQMASQLGRVVARDLPSQPTWLRNAGGAPDTAYDGAWCGGCHTAEYAAWSLSVHAQSAADPMVQYAAGVERQVAGSQIARMCAGCHDPVAMRSAGDSSLGGRGVTCLGCHDVTGLTQGGGNADLQATTHDWTQDHKLRATASLDRLRQPEFCGGCHQQFVPGTGLVSIGTLAEHATSPFATSTPCVDCHMKPVGGARDHRFPGGNVFLGDRGLQRAMQADSGVAGAAAFVADQTYNLQHALQMDARRVDGGVLVTLRNAGAGHWFPTGVTDIREPWIELQPRDASGNVLAHLGGPATPGDPLPAGVVRLGIDLAGADGGLLLRHEISAATRVPFDERVPSGEAQSFFLPVSALPAGTQELDAVLLYRNVRTTFYQAATAGDPDAGSAAPQTEMARAIVAP